MVRELIQYTIIGHICNILYGWIWKTGSSRKWMRISRPKYDRTSQDGQYGGIITSLYIFVSPQLHSKQKSVTILQVCDVDQDSSLGHVLSVNSYEATAHFRSWETWMTFLCILQISEALVLSFSIVCTWDLLPVTQMYSLETIVVIVFVFVFSFAELGLELRAYTSSHCSSPFL